MSGDTVDGRDRPSLQRKAGTGGVSSRHALQRGTGATARTDKYGELTSKTCYVFEYSRLRAAL